jgi:hypothetical protein
MTNVEFKKASGPLSDFDLSRILEALNFPASDLEL